MFKYSASGYHHHYYHIRCSSQTSDLNGSGWLNSPTGCDQHGGRSPRAPLLGSNLRPKGLQLWQSLREALAWALACPVKSMPGRHSHSAPNHPSGCWVGALGEGAGPKRHTLRAAQWLMPSCLWLLNHKREPKSRNCETLGNKLNKSPSSFPSSALCQPVSVCLSERAPGLPCVWRSWWAANLRRKVGGQQF